MSNPVRQHYIPKSYLKNFAQKRNGVDWVDTLRKGEKKIKQLSTTNICVEKNLYTFPPYSAGDRFALEKFYAEHVDSVFPEVYEMLSNPNIVYLPEDDKRKVLNTLLSLYFRTPRFLNKEIEAVENAFRGVEKQCTDPEDTVTVDWGEGPFNVQCKDLDRELENRKIVIKGRFLINHFGDWQAFVNYKIHCGIIVITVPDDVPIITCDNPISISDIQGNIASNIFEPSNVIEIPIDPRTYLVVMPNSVSDDDGSFVQRTVRDKYFAAGTNLMIEKNFMQRLIAYPGHLQIHTDSQRDLGAPTKENWIVLENQINSVRLTTELYQVIAQFGLLSQQTADKVREIRMIGLLNNDPTFKKMIEGLAANGYLTF